MGKSLQSAVQLVSELPLQLIDAHSFMLLRGRALAAQAVFGLGCVPRGTWLTPSSGGAFKKR